MTARRQLIFWLAGLGVFGLLLVLCRDSFVPFRAGRGGNE